jgi:hypothetical protein
MAYEMAIINVICQRQCQRRENSVAKRQWRMKKEKTEAKMAKKAASEIEKYVGAAKKIME